MKRILFSFFASILSVIAQAQYAPQVPLSGHNAIHRNDTLIKAWANSCTVHRGWINIADTTIGKVSAGIDSFALGKADNLTLTLGDGGYAIVTFENPITNLDGPDFVVFENGIKHALNDTLAFLELATVAVSSNGVDFVTFPCVSLTPADTQLDTFGYIDARHIHNLAGKYTANWGTPFDLEDLKDSSNIDINRITHVKITDVVGSIFEDYATYDTHGTIINDPYPTPFYTGGFDLDAVGVINSLNNNSITEQPQKNFRIYPNPSRSTIHFTELVSKYRIVNNMGTIVVDVQNASTQNIDISQLAAGNYTLGIWFNENWFWYNFIKE